MLRISAPCTLTVKLSDQQTFFALNANTADIYFQKFNTPSKVITFNLPQPGGYNLHFNQPVELLEKTQLQYVPVLFDLPHFDNPQPIPQDLTVIINPELKDTPAQTIPGIRLIQFQPEVKFWPDPIRAFIMYHELGHFHYESCKNADLFALKMFFEKGYNVSQAIYALIDFRNYTPVALDLALSAYAAIEPLNQYNYVRK